MSVAMINNVQTIAPDGAIAYKYADPTDGARWIYTVSELEAIRSECPSLIVEIFGMFILRLTTLDCVPAYSADVTLEAANLSHAIELAEASDYDDLDWQDDLGRPYDWDEIASSNVVVADLCYGLES